VFGRLAFRHRPENDDNHTVARFALSQLGHLPETDECFIYGDWRFEIVDPDGRRIDKILVTRKDLAP
jgi:CBS domain containing-hemolysin-like protein